MAYQLMPSVFFAYQVSSYNTEQSWIFALGYFTTDSDESAIADGNKVLSNLAGSPVPEYDKEGYWFCKFELGTEYTALAFNSANLLSPMQVKQYFQKRMTIRKGTFSYPGSVNTTDPNPLFIDLLIMHRCEWCTKNPLYIKYHDEEWGVPVKNPQKLFEMVVLEGMQAGLSWLTVLRKREAMRKAFKNFSPGKS